MSNNWIDPSSGRTKEDWDKWDSGGFRVQASDTAGWTAIEFCLPATHPPF